MTRQFSDAYALLTLAAAILLFRGGWLLLAAFIILIGSGYISLKLRRASHRLLLQVLTIASLLLIAGVLPVLLALTAYFAPKIVVYLYYRTTISLPRDIKKIVIQRADAIGDTVLATAAIAPVKKLFPGARIDFLCRDFTSELVAAHPALDQVIVHPGNKEQLISLFKEHQYSLIISLWEDELFPLAAWRAGIPYRCGPLESKKYGWLYNCGVFRRLNFATHQIERNFDIIKSLGATGPITLDLHLSEANKEKAANLFPPGDFIVALSPGTSGTNKALSAKTYGRFIDLAAAKFSCKFILLGGEAEKTIAAEIAAACGENIYDLTGKTTVGENAALIARCRFHVGCDSGPTHLAAGVKTPCLVIYTSKAQKPLTWGPWGIPHRIVRKAVDCNLICATRSCEANYCADQISAEELLEEFSRLVAGEGVADPLETKRYWAAKSLNILLTTNDGPTMAALTEEGFNVFLPSNVKIDRLVEQDISVIYNPKGRVGPIWRLAALLAGAYLNFAPAVIDKSEGPISNWADHFLKATNEKHV